MAIVDPLTFPPRFQFGQSGVPNKLAKTACADTCVQMLIEYHTGKLISLNDIRKASGAGIDGVHGLTIQQTIKALKKYGVPAAFKLNVTADWVAQKSRTGPLIVGTGYRKYPSWKGNLCGNDDCETGGKTQCNFYGAHSVLFIRAIRHFKPNTSSILHIDAVVRDPNHHSAARPEQPKFDRMRLDQFEAAMKALVTDTAWDKTFAVYPITSNTVEEEELLEAPNVSTDSTE